MADPLDLTGWAAVVTGGCRGVGRGITERFLAAGSDVIVCCRREPDVIPEAGGKAAVYVEADVREPEYVERVVTAVLERFGRFDVLVNNAGGSPPADAATASPRFSESIIRLNLIAPLLFAQQANAVMQAEPDGGVIVNIASVSGVRPSPGTAAYGAAKAGLLSLTQSLAIEYAPKVRVNAVTVGLVRTEGSRLHYGDEQAQQRVAATVPLGRFAEPEDVGNACVWLASPLASYVTGAALTLHGGGERPAYAWTTTGAGS